MFWLFDNKKPSLERVDRERKLMDDDENGTISQMEWFGYFCSTKLNSDDGIVDYYDFGLRNIFEKDDKTKTGHLNQDEV